MINVFKSVYNFAVWIYRVYFNADQIIGRYPTVKAKDHRVNLFDYHPEISLGNTFTDNRWNLGDSLGFVVTSFMLGKKGYSLDMPVKKRKHFGCIGSNVFSSFQHLTFWGGGVLCQPKQHYDKRLRFSRFLLRYPFSKFDFRAVRGPLTRDVVLKYGHQCPEVYGDPAILMPYIYTPQCEVTHDFLVIPQFFTEADFRQRYPNIFMVSMNTDDYKSVIDAIASSKKVITSSLHGIILAEAYGVPAVFFRGLGKNIDFKYLDYYYSTGRCNIYIADSFEEALKMEPLPLPDLKTLQEGLLKTFPYDLWEDNL